MLSPSALHLIYLGLTLVYAFHVVRTVQVNLPYLRAGVPEDEKYHFGSVVALNATYFANFGAELAFAEDFEDQPKQEGTTTWRA